VLTIMGKSTLYVVERSGSHHITILEGNIRKLREGDGFLRRFWG